jgi:hypothetical protein
MIRCVSCVCRVCTDPRLLGTDIQRTGQEPREVIQQITETVYPMYKARHTPHHAKFLPPPRNVPPHA